MEIMKKLMIIVALCMGTCTLWAQNEVSLVVSGEGKDKEEATFKALRSAIEQAYGTFVSANTTVLNDQLVADEIVSLSSGNIQKYEYVSENKMPNGNTFVTLSATVSIDKLVSFAESKGMDAELKGSLFAMNIKKMEFDKQAEEKAVENLCKQLKSMLPNIIDFTISVKDPKKYSGNLDLMKSIIYASQQPINIPQIKAKLNDMFDIGFVVNPMISDNNMKIFNNLILKTLGELSLSLEERNNYNKTGIDMWGCYFNIPIPEESCYRHWEGFDNASPYDLDMEKVSILYPNWKPKAMDRETFVFRSEKSIECLIRFVDYFHLYIRNFIISDGTHSLTLKKYYDSDPVMKIIPKSDELYVIIDKYDGYHRLQKIDRGAFRIDIAGGSSTYVKGFQGTFQIDLYGLNGNLIYTLEEISKITRISVSKPADIFKDYLMDNITGIYYKFHNVIHKEADKPKTGDLVGINFILRTEDSTLIPMTYNEIEMDSIDYNDLYAAIRMMHIGDSATFIFNGQEFYDLMMDEEYEFGEEPLYLDIKLYGRLSKEEFEKLKLQRKETEDSTNE